MNRLRSSIEKRLGSPDDVWRVFVQDVASYGELLDERDEQVVVRVTISGRVTRLEVSRLTLYEALAAFFEQAVLDGHPLSIVQPLPAWLADEIMIALGSGEPNQRFTGEEFTPIR